MENLILTLVLLTGEPWELDQYFLNKVTYSISSTALLLTKGQFTLPILFLLLSL